MFLYSRFKVVAYSISRSCNLRSLVEASQANGFVEGEGELEEAAYPARELDDVVV